MIFQISKIVSNMESRLAATSPFPFDKRWSMFKTTINTAVLAISLMHSACQADTDAVDQLISDVRQKTALADIKQSLIKSRLSPVDIEQIAVRSHQLKESKVFAAAVACLKLDTKAHEKVAEFLGDKNLEIRISAVTCILTSWRTCPKAVSARVVEMGTHDEVIRACLAICQDSPQSIESFSIDPSPLVRAATAARINRLLGTQAVREAAVADLVARLSCDADQYVRSCAITAASEMNKLPDAFRNTLAAACIDTRPEILLIEPFLNDADKSVSAKYVPRDYLNNAVASTMIQWLYLDKAVSDIPTSRYSKYLSVQRPRAISVIAAMVFVEQFDEDAVSFVARVSDSMQNEVVRGHLKDVIATRVKR